MTEKVLYAELTPREFRERIAAAPIAYLPLGTLEWHGEHLPLGSDGIQSQGFFERLAARAGGIVLPMLFVGPDLKEEQPDGLQLYGMDVVVAEPELGQYTRQQLPGSAYWIAEEAFGVLLNAVLKQLRRAGFRIVVAHGHDPAGTWSDVMTALRIHDRKSYTTLACGCLLALGILVIARICRPPKKEDDK